MAEQGDLAALSHLLWLLATPDEEADQTLQSFTVALAEWWADHDASHLAFIARCGDSEVVGMAWLALIPRVPRPGVISRRSADIQSVFVMPEHRRRGIGAALVQTASEHALLRGVGRVTVHSGGKSVPFYERLGFASSRQLLQHEVE